MERHIEILKALSNDLSCKPNVFKTVGIEFSSVDFEAIIKLLTCLNLPLNSFRLQLCDVTLNLLDLVTDTSH